MSRSLQHVLRSVRGLATVAGRPRVLIMSGPTCVGKTRLALRMAGDLDGEIVSADSMQVRQHALGLNLHVTTRSTVAWT